MKPIRLLLVDDQSLFRQGLRTLLSAQAGIEIVGEAEDGEAAVLQVRHLQPDVVLMDLRMPVCNGVEATRRIRALNAKAAVIVLTTFDDDDDVFDAIRAGAAGYLLKDTSPQKLMEAIRAAARGESVLQPSIAAKVIAEFSRLSKLRPRTPSQSLLDRLSERELDVLRHVSRGRSNKEIAAELNIGEGTVKNHVTNVLSKLEVQDRLQAALKARELGLA
ncbi:response regulator [Planctomicrobium sp. SH664]|uniref:response regulator n=1 Tax=Planctomicrobium sp. SH664 TaxID=3448125 RepID=UPI003F5AE30C